MKSYTFFIISLIISSFLTSNAYSQQAGLIEQKLITLQEDTVYLSDIVKNKSLIFRYSVMDCKPCIDSLFSHIQKIEKDIDKKFIIFFTYFTNFRHFLVSARINQINNKIYLIPNNELAVTEDDINMPYFFIIDNQLNVSDLFIVYNLNKQEEELDTYFAKIKEYF